MYHTCQLCGESKLELLHDKGRGDKEVNNYVCANCGFVFVLPRPSIKKHEEQYKEGKFSQEARGSAKPEEKKFKHAEALAYKRFELLDTVLKDEAYSTEHKTFIEIGCGTGSFLRYMKGAGWDVLGLEPDKVFADAGAERYNVPIENMFLEEIGLEKKFDMVATFHVIEHVEDVNVFLTKINAVLNDNAILFIECPTIDHMYGPDKNFFFWDVHINTFSNKTLSGFLVKNGFEILNEAIFSGFVNIICRKKKSTVNYQKYFDDADRIKEIVANYNPKPVQRNKPSLLSKIKNKAKRVIKTVIKTENPVRNDYNFSDQSKMRIAHLGFHKSTNTGDILLFQCVRDLLKFEKKEISFQLIDLHEEVTEDLIRHLNRFDAILIGGGGLFLKDTNPNNISGWQWACPNDLMEKISKPVIVFAVGYNRFRGQDDFHSNFTDNVNILARKSIFFGIRNHGSMAKLKDYIQEDQQHKIVYQPCATTVIAKFDQSIKTNAADQKVLAVNIAFDRHQLRFQGKETEILWGIADALKHFHEEGWKIVLLVHVKQDVEAKIWFSQKGVPFEIVDLVGATKEDVYSAYEKFTIVMGMRGHAQMIPFGLNIPIITLATHDKMMYFLEDINHAEWGIELVKSKNLTEEIIEKVNHIDENYQTIKSMLKDSQDALWLETERNVEAFLNQVKV